MFRVAIIGCGGVAPMHCDGYRSHPERVQMVAACDLDVARARRLQEAYDIPAVFDSLDAALTTDWEVGVVCTPTSVREPVVAALAAAGRHVYVEKPLADSYEEARRMVAVCEGGGVLLAVDQNFRYHYPFVLARRLIREGKIGPATQIIHQDLQFRQDAGWRTGQRRHALSVMGIHWLDGLRWMLGSDARSLACQVRSSAAIDCAGETEATVQITFEDGTFATYMQSFSSPFARTETLVIGEAGMLTLDYGWVTLHDRTQSASPVERWVNPYAGANKPESAYAGLNALLTALEEVGTPENGAEDNLKTVALLEAAYRSADRQAIVTFQNGLPT